MSKLKQPQRLPLPPMHPDGRAKRQCVYVSGDVTTADGQHIPSLVTEGEYGHAPLTGDPSRLQMPWAWGTLEQAEEIAREFNARLGLTERDVTLIVLSSMGQRRPRRAKGAK